MKLNLNKKLFLTLFIIGIIPMIIFSFLTISGYQEIIEKQSQHLVDAPNVIQETALNYQNIKIQTALIFLLLVIFILFFSIIFSRKFLYPIKKLMEGTEYLKKGDLKARIMLNTHDEFSDVATSFNNMAEKLSQKIDELKKSKKSIKLAYEKLKNEQNKVSSIINNFSDPIIMVDNNWKIALLNPSAKAVFNLSDDNIGRKLNVSKGEFTFASLMGIIKSDCISKIIKEKEEENYMLEEVVIKSKVRDSGLNPFDVASGKYDRSDIIYKVTTIPVCDENNICYGFMKIFYNLTREKMIDRLKSEFVSIAAHQLRTPLTAIKWAIKMVLNKDAGPLTGEQEEILSKGYLNNERVIKLINDMLNVSRIEEGRFGYNFSQENIKDILELVIENLRKRIDDKNLKFTVKIPSKISKLVMDKEKIELVLQNLLENSIKFTPEYGSISLEIKSDKKYLNIIVQDNGVGIPDKVQKKIFSKFFRGNNVVRIETEGSGLGLFIVKNIIDKHNGKINFESEEAKGTKFVVSLPLINKKLLLKTISG